MTEWYEDIFDSDYIKAYSKYEKETPKDVDGIIELMSPSRQMKILDLACGYGRHSLELAKRGYKVTGYDLSGFFLDYARKKAEKENLNVRFIEGDMRDLDFSEEFDVVLNLFTSFGYFGNDENQEVLAAIYKALVPNGRLLMQLINPMRLIRGYNPHVADELEGEGVVSYTSRDLDLEKNVICARRRLFFEDGKYKEYSFDLRMYFLPEMISLLENAQLQLVDYYGSLQGDPFSLDSPHQVIIAEKTL